MRYLTCTVLASLLIGVPGIAAAVDSEPGSASEQSATEPAVEQSDTAKPAEPEKQEPSQQATPEVKPAEPEKQTVSEPAKPVVTPAPKAAPPKPVQRAVPPASPAAAPATAPKTVAHPMQQMQQMQPMPMPAPPPGTARVRRAGADLVIVDLVPGTDPQRSALVTVRNIGGASSGPAKLKIGCKAFSGDSNCVADQSTVADIGALPPGSTAALAVTLKILAKNGGVLHDANVHVCADSTNGVKESDEANNCRDARW